jgi:hypothetical protein
MFANAEHLEYKAVVGHVHEDDVLEPIGAGVLNLLRGLYAKSLAPNQSFRGAGLQPIDSPVTGNWKYTQIYISDGPEATGIDQFDLHPKKAVIISENAENELLTLTYCLNDVSHTANTQDDMGFFDFAECVTRAAFFLLRGRPMTFTEEIGMAILNGEFTEH